jgi:hypothetical protein
MDEQQKDEFRKGLVEGGEASALGLAKGETLVQLSYSEKPTAAKPEPLMLFSNFNFTQCVPFYVLLPLPRFKLIYLSLSLSLRRVRRDLDIVTAPIHPHHPLDATSLSALMAGASLPPGLRFPTGTVIGHHLLIFGTFLSHAVNNFSIWALDLGEGGGAALLDSSKAREPLNWIRIDPGSVLSKGSWNRAVGWKNSVVVLGDRGEFVVARSRGGSDLLINDCFFCRTRHCGRLRPSTGGSSPSATFPDILANVFSYRPILVTSRSSTSVASFPRFHVNSLI